MIVLPNGFNVYPEDIENALRIAGLRDSVVVETRPGRIEAIVLAGAAVRPARLAAGARRRQVAAGAGDAAILRARIDAIVKAANGHLGPNQRIAGWRLWPEEDFPRTHTLKVIRATDPGVGGRRHRPRLRASRRPGIRPPTFRAPAGSRGAAGSCAAPGSQSYRTSVTPTWRRTWTVPWGDWIRPGPVSR